MHNFDQTLKDIGTLFLIWECFTPMVAFLPISASCGNVPVLLTHSLLLHQSLQKGSLQLYRHCAHGQYPVAYRVEKQQGFNLFWSSYQVHNLQWMQLRLTASKSNNRLSLLLSSSILHFVLCNSLAIQNQTVSSWNSDRQWLAYTSCIAIIHRRYSDKKQKRKRDLELEDTAFENISYQEAGGAQTSNIMETLPLDTVPISTIVRRLNRQDSNNSEQDEEREEGRARRQAHSQGHTNVRLTRRQRMMKRFSWTSHQSWRSYTRYVKRKLTKRESGTHEDEPAQTTLWILQCGVLTKIDWRM